MIDVLQKDVSIDRLIPCTDARGIVTAYACNLYGDLVSQSYSDATPAVTYAYDALGRQTQATDAVGTTVFAYNAYGEQESETVSGLYSKTLIRHRDAYGRDTGYSLDGSRKVTVEYDGDTGRIGRAQMGGGWMSWDYLPGTDLKSSLTYPNGATAAWTYEDDRDLLTRVANTVNGTVTSQYDYTHDLLGRRTAIAKSGSMMAAAENQTYGYNTRDELISGQGLTYAYDDIGNRTAAEGRTYAANSLNQYTAIDTFEPEYDADGNQTRVLTSTGEWTVEYNAEKRPVRWTQDGIVITMAYDRMGRRVEYRETRDGAHYMHAKYVYDGYLCVQRLYGATGRVYQAFAWDPTEPVATRPLMLQVPDWGSTLFYAHDGNKNVSEVFYYALGNGIAAHYDYAPFGAVIRTAKATSVARDILSENPFRFSSEVHDNSLGLVYYNYRHYNPKDGRWLGRDLIKVKNYYGWSPLGYDALGLATRAQMMELLSFFLGCANNPDLTGRVRRKYSESVDVLMNKLVSRNCKDSYTEWLEGVKAMLDNTKRLANKLDMMTETETDDQDLDVLYEALDAADEIIEVLSVINAATGDISSKDAAEVLNFFIDVTAVGQLGGRASGYFGYLKTGVDLSLNMVADIDETLTQQILSVIKGSMNRCPCLDALAGLSMLKGELREVGTIFNAVGR